MHFLKKKARSPPGKPFFENKKMHSPAGNRIPENKTPPSRYRNEAPVCPSTRLSASNFPTNSRKAPSPPRTRVT